VENRWNLHQVKRFDYSQRCGSRVKKRRFPDWPADFPTAFWKSCGQIAGVVENLMEKLTNLWEIGLR
jgi:hypothetical protein